MTRMTPWLLCLPDMTAAVWNATLLEEHAQDKTFWECISLCRVSCVQFFWPVQAAKGEICLLPEAFSAALREAMKENCMLSGTCEMDIVWYNMVYDSMLCASRNCNKYVYIIYITIYICYHLLKHIATYWNIYIYVICVLKLDGLVCDHSTEWLVLLRRCLGTCAPWHQISRLCKNCSSTLQLLHNTIFVHVCRYEMIWIWT